MHCTPTPPGAPGYTGQGECHPKSGYAAGGAAAHCHVSVNNSDLIPFLQQIASHLVTSPNNPDCSLQTAAALLCNLQTELTDLIEAVENISFSGTLNVDLTTVESWLNTIAATAAAINAQLTTLSTVMSNINVNIQDIETLLTNISTLLSTAVSTLTSGLSTLLTALNTANTLLTNIDGLLRDILLQLQACCEMINNRLTAIFDLLSNLIDDLSFLPQLYDRLGELIANFNLMYSVFSTYFITLINQLTTANNTLTQSLITQQNIDTFLNNTLVMASSSSVLYLDNRSFEVTIDLSAIPPNEYGVYTVEYYNSTQGLIFSYTENAGAGNPPSPALLTIPFGHRVLNGFYNGSVFTFDAVPSAFAPEGESMYLIIEGIYFPARLVSLGPASTVVHTTIAQQLDHIIYNQERLLTELQAQASKEWRLKNFFQGDRAELTHNPLGLLIEIRDYLPEENGNTYLNVTKFTYNALGLLQTVSQGHA
jgi:hypothetical protein